MDAGRPGVRRPRFATTSAATSTNTGYEFLLGDSADASDLNDAIGRTRDWLLNEQHANGHWCGELEGDSILESEYLLLLTWMGREKQELAGRLCREILVRQEPHGGWALYPGGPTEVSASVKSYLSLRIAGHDVNAPHMAKAREAILAAGGAERVNSFTRYYLALLGLISYEQCPAVPPELVLLPNWCPFNIYEMSAWSRTIIVPLSLLWAHRPRRDLPAEGLHVRELFLRSPEELPVCMNKTDFVETAHKFGVNWQRFFSGVDRAYKFVERTGALRPFRKAAVAKATGWMNDRLVQSDGLGAIFPPIIWSIVALKCLGHDDNSPQVLAQLKELEALHIDEEDRTRVQPCKSPVWDTAIATIALREAGLPPQHPSIRDAVNWLLEQQIRSPGDWSVRRPKVQPGAWAFEYNNAFYPDIDDTSMVVMALTRALPARIEHPWAAEFLLDPPEKNVNAAVLTAEGVDPQDACEDLGDLAPMLTAIWRGVRWILAMQSRDGGWGAFDADNTRWVFTQVPFADHNAMIDPSTADLTARMLEMFGLLGAPASHVAVKSALEFMSAGQEEDGSWYGRWGVNYLYGTWQALLGMAAINIPRSDLRIRKAVRWLVSVQQESGGWGETVASYDEPELRGRGLATASQTAWALMGLIAAGEADSEAVARGVQYLIETQKPDGTWDEAEFTGTGFPQVFYLRYHLYCIYFPLMALGRYQQALRSK